MIQKQNIIETHTKKKKKDQRKKLKIFFLAFFIPQKRYFGLGGRVEGYDEREKNVAANRS